MAGSTLRRWAAVGVVAAMLIALPVVMSSLPATATVDPGKLRALILSSADQPYQGYAESTGSLGVPNLPYLSDMTSLLNSTTRIRSWYDSPTSWRFDEISDVGERDVYQQPGSEYIWDYGQDQLTHVIGDQPVRLPRGGDLLPPNLARLVLQTSSGDRVSALPARRVAGVDAAGLRVVPADPDTAVGQVDIWADPKSGLPVRVELTARGQNAPILVTGFVELTQNRPSADVLTAKPSPATGFNTTPAPDVLGLLGPTRLPARLAGHELQANAVLYGTGLSAFGVLPLPRNTAGSVYDAMTKAGAATVKLPFGQATTLTIKPVSVLVARIGRRAYLLGGTVDPTVLTKAATELSKMHRRRP